MLALLLGCAWTVGGRWELDRVSVGDQEVLDAGFLDLRGTNNKGIAPPVMLMRYWYDLELKAFVPDPTPEVVDVSADVEEKSEDGLLEFSVAFPIGEDEIMDVPFSMETSGGRTRQLEYADFPGGLVMELSR